MSYISLSNGLRIPDIGFGTYKLNDSNDNTIALALKSGYRLFDTASFYDNYDVLKEALNSMDVPRKDIFISSKCWRTEMGYEKAIASYNFACQKLGVEFLDMFLIHWPRPNLVDENWKEVSRETWRALEDLYLSGKVKSIGVSNFMIEHLDNILDNARIIPMVNQIEFHPGYIQNNVLEYCKVNKIQVMGWSPLGCNRLSTNALLNDLAKKYSVTLAQICIRYALQKNVIPLPKSSSADRMKNNMDVYGFEITLEDIKLLDNMPLTAWSGEHPDHERVKF
ncbi:MAG: aldo/keto reductase [Erysipelotrichaceae bacterium]